MADALRSDAMYSGWGVRTLSQQAAAYTPIGYHLGTVWPHDSALVAAGFNDLRVGEATVHLQFPRDGNGDQPTSTRVLSADGELDVRIEP